MLILKSFLLFVVTQTILLAASAWAASPAEDTQTATRKALVTEADAVNYSIGYQIGTDFKNQGWEITPEILVQGIQDAMQGNKPQIDDAVMKATLANMKRKLVLAQEKATLDYQKASEEYLVENARKDGVVVLPSGVQYKVLRPGAGKTPTLDDTIRVHFKIFKVDGTEVGSTYATSDPRVVTVASALPGLRQVLVLMKEGAKYQIVLPNAMTTNNREKDDSGLAIYEMELVSIKPK